jgi:hypothetical protein
MGLAIFAQIWRIWHWIHELVRGSALCWCAIVAGPPEPEPCLVSSCYTRTPGAYWFCRIFSRSNIHGIMVMVTLMLDGHVILIPVVVTDRDNIGPPPIRWSLLDCSTIFSGPSLSLSRSCKLQYINLGFLAYYSVKRAYLAWQYSEHMLRVASKGARVQDNLCRIGCSRKKKRPEMSEETVT